MSWMTEDLLTVLTEAREYIADHHRNYCCAIRELDGAQWLENERCNCGNVALVARIDHLLNGVEI
jgi:hypothetical protein